jgi:hypothetical protein
LKDFVKRRAILSLQGNPQCSGVAAQAVEAAFEKCFYDYSPLTKDDVRRGTCTKKKCTNVKNQIDLT